MKRLVAAGIALSFALHAHAQIHLDLSTLLDTDTVSEATGEGIGAALDDDGRRIDAASLPADYTDGSVVTTVDGRTTFRFAPLRQPVVDAVAVDGQAIAVPEGHYESLDLALLAAPGALVYPFGEIELRYSDGTRDALRLGPVPGWFASPMSFDHTLYRFTDDSGVETIASFATMSDDEVGYVVQERGNGNAGGTRFVDATGYVLYRFGELGDLDEANLGIVVGNNFVISLAAEYSDPEFSPTEGYTVVADSMEIHDGFEHRALGNLRQYDIDLAPFLAQGTGEIYVLLTDATPADGWGPFIQRLSLYTGTPESFEDVLEPTIRTGQATVHAMFRTATEAEAPYLYDNSGSGPSNRGHRFADGTGSIVYRFDLPDDTADAELTVHLANNFVVSLSGPGESTRYFNVLAATPDERNFLLDEGGSIQGSDFRFADGTATMTYRFDLPDDVATAFARIHVGNQFVVEAAAGDDGEFVVERDWVAETGEATTDLGNLDFYDFDLTPYLADNPSRIVRLRLSDGLPGDGWGPYLKSIAILDRLDAAEPDFVPVLDAFELFGEDIRTEYNKRYYTVNLASVLENNPTREFFVKFTDGSTSDGWGPGIFWMAVHTGALEIETDRLVFEDLKTTGGDPVNYGAGLLHRRYPIAAGKTLNAIGLPPQPSTEDNRVYLLAATLNETATGTMPTLDVASTPAGTLRLSWPATAEAFELQTRSTLVGPDPWVDVAGTPETVDGRRSLEVTPSDSERYYRLVR